jgi:hypothetical protein
MASTFKRLNTEDTTIVRTPIYEAIPITGTLVSSSVYGTSNIKTYSHGMFETVYDYPYLSSSANQLFDITIGRTNYDSSSIQQAQKRNVYSQMAQVLVGYDLTGSIEKFGDKSTATLASDHYYQNMIFLTFSRLLVKDEIKRGTFSLTLGTSNDFGSPFGSTMVVDDSNALTTYYNDSPTGDYGILKVTSGGSNTQFTEAGIIFYQAGVVALSPYVFAASGSSAETASFSSNQKGQLASSIAMSGTNGVSIVTGSIETMFLSASIQGASDAFRRRVANVQFNNTTELNSTIYFCRANHNEFNYSSNPTYLSSSQIVVKQNPIDAPISYITTVGLYSADNELLAVAKLSEPIKKTPDESILLRVRLDV